mmetsp:Transcript_10644/g.15024  ORF Transcript_10644/g.15024 Transcript_10644/m.15024 type:complete len:154 (+) Transcript_10644:3-464(+)
MKLKLKNDLSAMWDSRPDVMHNILINSSINLTLFRKMDHSDASMNIVGKKKTVRFSQIQVREYEIVPGYYPSRFSQSRDPRLSLGWAYNIKGNIDLDRYENFKQNKRRTIAQMPIPSVVREEILLEFGFAKSQMTYDKKRKNHRLDERIVEYL